MSTLRYDSPKPPMRRSTQVALVLLGAAGVVGAATLWDYTRPEPQPPVANADQPLEAADANKEYSNNQYSPGLGYYHAPYFGWFPFPWNYHDSGRGYFAGGNWHASPLTPTVDRSRPTAQAVSVANSLRQQEEERRRRSGFAGGGSGRSYSNFGSAHPTPAPSNSSITRGGFGSSSRSGAT